MAKSMVDTAAVLDLQRQGRYRAAFDLLDSEPGKASETVELQLVRSELSETLGLHADAQPLTTRILKSTRLTPSQRARCECVLGRLLVEDGRTDEGTSH